ncbi:MAG: S41 family peptidase [Flavobacteriaceae bacterium]|nr:S41 family peptidase [Flavobacteriaceae bacterium]
MKKIKNSIIAISLFLSVTVLFSFKTDFFEVAKQIEIYTTLFKELNMYYIDEINPAKLTDNAIKKMLSDLDPYTRFYDEQGVEEAKINSFGEYSGIGAQSKYYKGKLIIVEIYKGFSADKAGLKVGDEIIKIDDIFVKSYQGSQVSMLLKGAVNSAVKVVVKRQNKTLNFNIVREKIIVNPVPHYQMITDEVGYIAFIRFNNKASVEVKNAIVDLKEQGMKKLILDVRGNPGGLLNEAISITNFFVPKNEIVVTTKAKLKKWSETYKTKNEPIDLEIPLVVLIDKNSASASEIVAGSLQDLDRAVIVGQRSFGKGLVQRYRNLSYGTKFKLTISKYYTPSGRNIQELDYTHRQGNKIPKFSDTERHSFKTKNGRTVYDGGGIEPDVKIENSKATETTKALLKSDAIFNYATNYYFKNSSIEKPENFIFNDSDYQEFINYLKEDSTTFKTASEKKFELAFKTAEEEKLTENIANSYQNLLSQLQIQKINALIQNKEEIKENITDEIINRYYYKKGEYQNDIIYNQSIMEAVKILNNTNQYNQILNNEHK